MSTVVRRVSDMDSDRVKYRGKGYGFTATAGATTNGDFKIDGESRLIDGTRLILKGHAFGDHVKFQVVDIDNVIGYGAGLVLDEFATSWFVNDECQDQGAAMVPYPAELVAGLYVRVVYTSVGATDVQVKCNLSLHKYLA